MSIDDSPMLGDPDPPPPPPSEAVTFALFEQAAKGNTRRLLSIARAIAGGRAAPEDIVQQALVNLFEHRARYDWREPGPLMRRAVVNEALRLLRQPRLASVADDHPSAGMSPAGEMIGNETVQKVRRAIDQLPEHFRTALVLCEYENMSYAQIADTLGASVPQVKTWLHRGRRKLAELLQEFVKTDTPLDDLGNR